MPTPTAPAVRVDPSSPRVGVELLRGRAALRRLSPALLELQHAVGAPLTARVPWARAAFAATPELEPWTIATYGSDGRLAAATVLSLARRGRRVVLASPRPGSDDRLAFAARSPRATNALVDGLVTWVAGMREAWRLELTGLDPRDPAVRLLAARLPAGRVESMPDVPAVSLEAQDADDVARLFRDDVRRRIRTSLRRLAAEAIDCRTHVVRHPEDIVALLDTLEAAHRARDHAAGRTSDLDDPSARAFWRGVIAKHAARRSVEVSLLRFDGDIAAYVIAFLDPPVYRVFDGRLSSRWATYSPGRLLEADVLARVARTPLYARIDWMTSVAPEKLIAANRGELVVRVLAEHSGTDPRSRLTAGM